MFRKIHIYLLINFVLIFFFDGWNTIKYGVLDYDGSYNATVAANVARSGEYKISYPKEIVFDNKITTGELVLLPTALLYKLNGINTLSSSLIVLVYSTLAIIISYLLISDSFAQSLLTKSVVVMMLMMFILSDRLFGYISTNLVGESACLLLCVLSGLFLTKYYKKPNSLAIMLSGVCIVASFLTKSSMIVVFITFCGVILLETVIFRSIKLNDFLSFVSGVFLGWIILESYKLFQLGGLHQYFTWWGNEWQNMMRQSSGVNTSISVLDKVNHLSVIFNTNKYFALFLTFLPITLYLYRIVLAVKRKDVFVNSSLAILNLGLCGASLIVYFILLGGQGLFMTRRQWVNQFILKIYFVYFIAFLFNWLLLYLFSKNYDFSKFARCILVSFVIGVLLAYAYPIENVTNGFYKVIEKYRNKTYDAQLMEQFLDEVNELPASAVIYCNRWWQEPQISLILNRKMISVADISSKIEKLDVENGYFVIGRRHDNAHAADIAKGLGVKLTKVDKINVNYSIIQSFGSHELFSIYKMSR